METSKKMENDKLMYDEKLFRKVATEMGLEIIEDSSVDLVNGEPSDFLKELEELCKHFDEAGAEDVGVEVEEVED